MFNDEGMGAAMEAAHNRNAAKSALERVAHLEKRIAELAQIVKLMNEELNRQESCLNKIMEQIEADRIKQQ